LVSLLFRSRFSAQRESASADAAAAPTRFVAEPDEASAMEGKRDRWWYESSYDLRRGLDVDDTVASTMPGDLIDQLFQR
jgi:hypothetical protein